jgi:hypothetical protein
MYDDDEEADPEAAQEHAADGANPEEQGTDSSHGSTGDEEDSLPW